MNANSEGTLTDFEHDLATVMLGVDTVYGGDVSSESGVKRFIADSYFSGKPFPEAYTDDLADELRDAEGIMSDDTSIAEIVMEYVKKFELFDRIRQMKNDAAAFEEFRREYIEGLADSLGVMLKIALSHIGKGKTPEYDDIIVASVGEGSGFINPREQSDKVASVLAKAGFRLKHRDLYEVVDEWRSSLGIMTGQEMIDNSDRFIQESDALTAKRIMPYLPSDVLTVPRTNIRFIPTPPDAFFSGSNNYIGRERDERGNPKYEGTYEINPNLKKTLPEFKDLVAHEVSPGHQMNTSICQNLYHRGILGFEVTMGVMNSRMSALFEGVATTTNRLLYSESELSGMDIDVQITDALRLMSSIASNNASYMFWKEKKSEKECGDYLRKTGMVPSEHADRVSSKWLPHPLMGAMYLPQYYAGQRMMIDAIGTHGREKVIPVVYHINGLMDIVTAPKMLARITN